MPPKKKIKVDSSRNPSDDGNLESDCEIRNPIEQKSKTADEKKPKRKKNSSTDAENIKVTQVFQNKTSTEFHEQDFGNTSKTPDGKKWNTKVVTWNVDGLRAWIKKGGLDYLEHENPDILCLQETKCSKSKLPQEVVVPGYHTYWCFSEADGHAGLGLYTTVKPDTVSYGIGIPEFDKEGRLIIAEYNTFYVVNVYVPNSGRKLVTLDKRLKWNPKFQELIKDLDSKKPVIICGDMNVAHQEIDIAHPKSNKRNAGFTQEERDGFSELLKSAALTDCFRQKHPDVKGAYTFWTYMANARKKNIGWRLDYCLLSKKLMANFCDCCIRSEVYGSDHCPVVSFLHL
ncbi:DNA-(apurinic or apyrimidinic site) endonuclease [Daphnia magna]|uniref:DNA-(apurinic or apyrimidinic site) endonuclease n=1 Tax=Daphnia magna TaxID=35525 RepID=UPI001E1BD339|nr:DNA-(apurinic or apyrimidinic site) endonuclease [Daphnia magna]